MPRSAKYANVYVIDWTNVIDSLLDELIEKTMQKYRERAEKAKKKKKPLNTRGVIIPAKIEVGKKLGVSKDSLGRRMGLDRPMNIDVREFINLCRYNDITDNLRRSVDIVKRICSYSPMKNVKSYMKWLGVEETQYIAQSFLLFRRRREMEKAQTFFQLEDAQNLVKRILRGDKVLDANLKYFIMMDYAIGNMKRRNYVQVFGDLGIFKGSLKQIKVIGSGKKPIHDYLKRQNADYIGDSEERLDDKVRSGLILSGGRFSNAVNSPVPSEAPIDVTREERIEKLRKHYSEQAAARKRPGGVKKD